MEEFIFATESIEAAKFIAEEIKDIFWLIFWFGVFGFFSTTVNTKGK